MLELIKIYNIGRSIIISIKKKEGLNRKLFTKCTFVYKMSSK